jgi:hypothetical protein
MHTIIDNFLEKTEFNVIESMLTGADFPWYFQNAVADLTHTHLSDFYFSHMFYRLDNNIPSQLFHIIEPVLKKIKVNKLIRIKGNLYPNVGKLIENQPHTDFPFEHKGAIFYINTNDGYTILNDGIKVESIANRILFFDASTPHQSTTCTDNKARININFNYF